jgi:hypothetical protein
MLFNMSDTGAFSNKCQWKSSCTSFISYFVLGSPRNLVGYTQAQHPNAVSHNSSQPQHMQQTCTSLFVTTQNFGENVLHPNSTFIKRTQRLPLPHLQHQAVMWMSRLLQHPQARESAGSFYRYCLFLPSTSSCNKRRVIFYKRILFLIWSMNIISPIYFVKINMYNNMQANTNLINSLLSSWL